MCEARLPVDLGSLVLLPDAPGDRLCRHGSPPGREGASGGDAGFFAGAADELADGQLVPPGVRAVLTT